jgi:hypothetical protein
VKHETTRIVIVIVTFLDLFTFWVDRTISLFLDYMRAPLTLVLEIEDLDTKYEILQIEIQPAAVPDSSDFDSEFHW